MLQVDIDNLSNPEEIKKILSKDKYIKGKSKANE